MTKEMQEEYARCVIDISIDYLSGKRLWESFIKNIDAVNRNLQDNVKTLPEVREKDLPKGLDKEYAKILNVEVKEKEII